MTEPIDYPQLEYRDEIISIFSNDIYIKEQIKDLNNIATIQPLCLLEFTVTTYPAISVEMAGEDDIEYLQDKNLLEEGMTPYRVDVACQDGERNVAYDNAFKLAYACKLTIENVRNLNFKCDYLEVTKLINSSWGQFPDWTFVWTFFIMVKDHRSLLNPN